ncbi:MAG: type IV pilus assembly protein PilM [Candidatus Omnitrophota bacterium]
MIKLGQKGKAQPRPKNRVGLDIGSRSVKILEVSNIPGRSVLSGLGMKNLPEHSSAALCDTIKSIIEESKISSKDVNIAVAGPSVIVRFITMPKMKEEELKGAIKFEAEKHIPFNINDCIIDFQVIGKEDRENKLNVLLVAVKKAAVEERLALVESCGLSVEVVDVDAFALANSFVTNFPSTEPDKTAALVNIGATFTNLTITKNGMIYLVRDMPIGSKDFDAAIAKCLSMDEKAAAAIKIDPKDKLKDIAACVRGVFNNLVDEMRLPFSYYENQSGRGVEEIYVSGGGSALTGLDEMIQDVFGAKPIFWDPLKCFDTSSLNTPITDEMKRSFAIAAGLALR